MKTRFRKGSRASLLDDATALCVWCMQPVARGEALPDEPVSCCQKRSCMEQMSDYHERLRNPVRDEDDPSVWPDGRR